jgi:hypothetical protein
VIFEMQFLFSKSGIAKNWVIASLAIIVIGSVLGAYELLQLSSSPSPTTTTNIPSSIPTQTPTTPIQTPTPTPTVGQFISVTGFAQYKLSQTEFVFVTETKTYNVTMDLTTRAVNLNGKLLGGYQIVSQLIPLQFTVTGTVSGSTIMAQTVLIPTTKDQLT